MQAYDTPSFDAGHQFMRNTNKPIEPFDIDAHVSPARAAGDPSGLIFDDKLHSAAAGGIGAGIRKPELTSSLR